MSDFGNPPSGPASGHTVSGRVFGRPRTGLAGHARSFESGRVSVIIPCYNSENFLGAAIESALGQSWRDLEVIVVDDGSTDDSRQAAAEFGDRVRTMFLDHQGAAAARNSGLEAATGEFLQFLDADDLLVADAVTSRLEAFDDDVDAVFGDLEFFDDDSGLSRRVTSHADWPGFDPLAHLIENNIYTEAPLHRRRGLFEIGGFDESLPCSQELDIHLRLYLAGAKFSYHPRVVARARVHATPDRIENSPWYTDDPDLHIRIVEHHTRLISNREPTLLSPAVKHAFAQKLWSRGVIAGRNGAFEVARHYFKRARGYDSNLQPKGSAIFRWLHALAGPLAVTWLLHYKQRATEFLRPMRAAIRR